MPRLPISGSDDGLWGNILNEYLLAEHDQSGHHDIKTILEIPDDAGRALLSDSGSKGYVWTTLTQDDVGLPNVDNTSDTEKPISVATQNALNNKLEVSGGPLTGSLDVLSNYAGGDNQSDSTNRVTLHSHQKAQLHAADGVSPGHFGEVLRIDIEKSSAKGAIAFREHYTGAGDPRTVAWLVAHGRSNDDPNIWHNHFSVEIPDENGMLQTALEFPFAPRDVANGFGMPLASHYTRSTRKFIASNNGITVEGQAGSDRNIHFSSGAYGPDQERRWSIQTDSASEAGGNAGSNFRISRRSDLGNFIDSPLYIQRSTGNVGVGNVTSPSARLHVERSNDGPVALVRNTNAAGNTVPNIGLDAQTATSRILQGGLQSDTIKRISIEASGLIEWGPGGGVTRDTNIYRAAAATLATDSNVAVKTAGRGIQVAEGSNAKMGTATVSNGSVTVATTAVRSQSRIFLTIQDYAGNAIPNIAVGTRTANASFTIKSSTNESVTVAWLIFDPA
jgi:hypothetical protein